jgi:hypothetical protein
MTNWQAHFDLVQNSAHFKLPMCGGEIFFFPIWCSYSCFCPLPSMLINRRVQCGFLRSLQGYSFGGSGICKSFNICTQKHNLEYMEIVIELFL